MPGTEKKRVRNKPLAPKAAERRPSAAPSADKFRTLADNSPDIIARFDRKFRHLYLNPAGERATGLIMAEMIGRTKAELGMPPRHVALWHRHLRHVFEKGRPVQFEFAFEGPEGFRCYEARLAPEFSPGGRIDSVLATSRDTTARVRGEEALRESEQRYRGLFEHMSEGFFLGEIICDESGRPADYRYLDTNEAFERLTGLKREETIGKSVCEALPGIESVWIETYGRVALTGKPARIDGFVASLGRHYATRAYSPRPNQFACLFEDITARVKGERKMFRLNRRLQALMEAVPVGVSFSDDPTCRNIIGNAVFMEQFELPPAENISASADDHSAYGHRIRYSREGRALTEVELPLQRAVAENRSIPPTELEVELPSGRRWFAEVLAAPVRDEHGRVVAGIAVSVDITERKRIEEALRTVNEKLRQTDRLKDEFLATLSHELRGPLAPIRSGVHILRQTTPGGEQARRALDIIDNQSGHLTRLVDDLLDLNRISRGQIKLKRRRCDLVDLARRAVEDHGEEFDGRGIALQIEEPRDPLRIDADPTRIAQIIGNLLGNACKFTPSGGRVRVDLAAEDNQAVLRIRDTGAGIETRLLGTIFDPLTQAKQSLARSTGGLGLGLSLVKKLVEMHGGAVHAASEGPGRGSEFTVRLPLLAGAASEESPQAAAQPPRRLRILVIEDYGDAAEGLRTVLELLGHETQVAVDGAAGLAAARTMEPDLVLCDIGLPDMDGYAVARQLRKAAGLSAVLLVALTGYALPEDAAKARDAGFDLHVAKPLSMEDLRRLLAAVSSRTKDRPRAES